MNELFAGIGYPLPPRILVVDDNREVAEFVGITLQLSPAVGRVSLALSAAAAWDLFELAHLSTEPFSLIICDLAMPDESGFHFVGRLREQERIWGCPPVHVVFYTAFSDPENAARAVTLGAVDVWIKARLEPAALRSRVLALLNQNA